MTVGTWLSLERFPYLDLVELPDVPSIFDIPGRHVRLVLRFLHRFAEDLARPVEPHLREIDYLPTQVFTAAVRQRLVGLSRQAPGLRPVISIRYRSAVRVRGVCWVVFVGTEGCTELGPDREIKPGAILGLVASSEWLGDFGRAVDGQQ